MVAQRVPERIKPKQRNRNLNVHRPSFLETINGRIVIPDHWFTAANPTRLY